MCVTTVKNAVHLFKHYLFYLNAKTGLGRHLTVQEGDDLWEEAAPLPRCSSHRQSLTDEDGHNEQG